MKTPIPKELVADLEAVLKKHGVDDLYYPFVFGQALDVLKEQCITNSCRWVLDGMLSSNIIRYDAPGIVKKLVEKLVGLGKRQPLNYNDLDVDLWGKYIKIPRPCLECSSNVRTKGLKTEDCTRCKGTGLDPDYFNHLWVLFKNDHGNSQVYIVQGNGYSTSFHVRDLPYNMSKKRSKAFFNKFVAAGMNDRFDGEFEYFRYHDLRDEGFVLSVEYNDDDKRVSDCDIGGPRAAGALSTIVEHFPWVIENFDVLSKEDTLPK